MSIPRVRHRYLLTAVLLALGAPVGALALRWGMAGWPLHPAVFVRGEVQAFAFFYGYLTLGTVAAFSVAAWIAGCSADRLATIAMRLEGLAMRDPVTGLFNRRYGERRLE